MFAVGTRTALITNAFALTFIASYVINQANLDLFPLWITKSELIYQVIDLPLTLMAGSLFYEAGQLPFSLKKSRMKRSRIVITVSTLILAIWVREVGL